MRVLTIALRFGSFGGAETVIRELTERIAKKCDLVLITDNKYLKEVDNYDFPIYRLKFFDISYLNNIEPLLFWNRKVRSLIKQLKPEVIHMHGCILPLNDLTSIMTVHGTYLEEIPYLSTYPSSKFYRMFYSSLVYTQFIYEQKTYKFAKYYHAVSTTTKKELTKFGIKSNQIRVIPNGVNCEVFRPINCREEVTKKLNLPENSKLVLYTGNIVPRKGLHLLIKAVPNVLKYHGDTHFLIVGNVPKLARNYIQYINKLVDSNKIKDNVKFLGKVPLKDLIKLYNACDIFVLPSYSEGFPLSVIEAAACGKSSVVSKNCGAKDLLGDDGYYFETGNSEDLARKIISALENSKFRNWKLVNKVRKNLIGIRLLMK